MCVYIYIEAEGRAYPCMGSLLGVQIVNILTVVISAFWIWGYIDFIILKINIKSTIKIVSSRVFLLDSLENPHPRLSCVSYTQQCVIPFSPERQEGRTQGVYVPPTSSPLGLETMGCPGPSKPWLVDRVLHGCAMCLCLKCLVSCWTELSLELSVIWSLW